MFTAADKQIFGPYWNGQANVFADPVAVRRRFQAILKGDGNSVLRAFRSDNPAESIPAGERLAAAVCAAFGLGNPFDPATGTGVLEAVWRPCLVQFLDWMDEKKKPSENSPT
jgi:hypothetical protein